MSLLYTNLYKDVYIRHTMPKGMYKEIERARRINEVLATLVKLKSKDLDYNHKKFVMEICLRYSVTERRAGEYIKLAQFKLDSVEPEIKEPKTVEGILE